MDILENDIIDYVIKPVVEDDMLDFETKILINPTGRFVVRRSCCRYRFNW